MNADERFEAAISFVLKNEGGFSNHDLDNGGATNYGITEATLSAYRGRAVTESEVRNLELPEAKNIYRQLYWNPLNLDNVENSLLCTMLFDQAVNRGVGTVKKQIERVLSSGAINSKAPGAVAFAFLKESQLSYARIVRANPTQSVFIYGWILRTHRILDLITAEMLGIEPR